MDWVTGIQKAIDYIENHITEKLDYEEIGENAFSSPYHFQRVFSILCGYTLGNTSATEGWPWRGRNWLRIKSRSSMQLLSTAMTVPTALPGLLPGSTALRLRLRASRG